MIRVASRLALACVAVLGGCVQIFGVSEVPVEGADASTGGHVDAARDAGRDVARLPDGSSSSFASSSGTTTSSSTASSHRSTSDGGATSSNGSSGSSASSGSGSSSTSSSSIAPIAFVQDGEGDDLTADNVANIHTSQFAKPLQSGDLVVVAVTMNNCLGDAGWPVLSVSDSNGNSFVGLDNAADPAHEQALYTLYAADVSGGALEAVKASFSPPACYVGIYAAEYSGLAKGAPVDVQKSVHISGAQAGKDSVGLTLEGASAGLLWGFAQDAYEAQASGGFAAGTGFTSRGPSGGVWPCTASGCGSGDYFARPEDRLLTSAGDYEATWSVGQADDFLCSVVVFLGGP